MKAVKKTIAILTVLLMVIGNLPIPAFADTAHPYVCTGTSSMGTIVGTISGANRASTSAVINLKHETTNETLQTYCSDIGHTLDTSEHFRAEDLSGSDADRHVRAIMYTDIDSLLGGLGIASMSGKDKVIAKQAAIWHFTDGLEVSSTTGDKPADILAVYNKLITLDAMGPTGSTAPAIVTIERTGLSLSGDGSTINLTFRYKCTSGSVVLTPTVSAGTLGAVTEDGGWKVVTVSNIPTGASFSITVSGSQNIRHDVCYFIPANRDCGTMKGQRLVGFPVDDTVTVSDTFRMDFGGVRIHKTFTDDTTAGDLGESFTVRITGGPGNQVERTVTVPGNGDYVDVSGLPFGDYSAAELLSDGQKSQYSIHAVRNSETNSYTFTIDSKGLTNGCITVMNRQLGSLRITKQLTPAAAAPSFRFHITGPGFPAEGEDFDLADDGSKLYEKLPYGQYTITEQPTDGYRLTGFTGDGAASDAGWVVTVGAGKRDVAVTANNEKIGGLAIVKTDSVTHGPVQGVTFRITGPNGFDQTQTTGADGKIVLADLKPGAYSVTETAAPAGYRINNASPVTKDVVLGELTQFDFSDDPVGKLSLIKQDLAGNPLPGAVFWISTDPSFATHTVYDTGDNSSATTDWLLAGTLYYVKEVKAPAGYVIPAEDTKQVIVERGKVTNVIFNDPKDEGSLKIRKVSAYDGAPVAGVKFELATDKDFTHLVSLPNGGKTNASGELFVQHLSAGSYWVREVSSVPGYAIDSTASRNVTVEFSKTATVEFVDHPLGRVRIVKTDAFDGSALAGAVFGVYSDPNCNVLKDTLDATDGDGHALSIELPFEAGTVYYVKEISAPTGYVMDDDVEQVRFTAPGQTLDVEFENERNFGGFIVRKELVSFAGDLQAFTFTLTGPSYPGGTEFTLKGGQQKPFDGLEFGLYTITETVSLPYELTGFTGGSGTRSGNSYSFTLGADNQGFKVTATNRRLATLTIAKALAGGGTGDGSDFSFRIEGQGVNETFTLKATGTKEFQNLKPGSYTITETGIPDGYRVSGFSGGSGTASGHSYTVTVGAADVLVTCTNVWQGRLEVVKMETGSMPPVYLEGAVFGIYTDADCKDEHLAGTMESGPDGHALSGWLDPGTYWVREIEAPASYNIDSDAAVPIDVTAGEIHLFTTEFTDTKKRGSIVLHKEFEAGNTDPDATFDVLVEGIEGTVFHETVTLPASGDTRSLSLPFGRYRVSEIPMPGSHYVLVGISGTGLNDNDEFTVGEDSREIAVTVLNRELLGSITLHKEFEAGNTDLDATFDVRVQGIGGTIYDQTVTLPANGETRQLDNLPYGRYRVTETLPAGSGYELVGISGAGLDENGEFSVGGAAVHINATVTNRQLLGRIQVTKTDANPANTPYYLGGAEFKISTAGGADFDSHVIQTITTADGTGYAFSDWMPVGVYWVKETKAPGGYAIDNADPVSVTLDEHLVTVNVPFSDTKKIGKIILHKEFESGNANPAATFDVLVEGIEGTVFHETVTLPATGETRSLDLPFGRYRVTEIPMVGGPYVFVGISGAGLNDNDEFTVGADSREITVTVTNRQLLGSITLHKEFEAGNTNPGATFDVRVQGIGGTVYDQTVTLPANGETRALTNLPFGRYRVTEVLPADGDYQLVDISGVGLDGNDEFYIGGATVHISATVTNRQLVGRIQVMKTDSNINNTPYYLGGAEFKVSTAGGADFDSHVIQTITTAEGTGFAFSDWMSLGVYWVKETKAPGGYVIDNASPVQVVLEDVYTTVSVHFTDTKNEGSIKARKVSALTGAPVAGVTFELLDKGPDDDGFTDANIKATAVTGPSGEVLFQHLTPGATYWVRETIAAPGYDLDPDNAQSAVVPFQQTITLTFANTPLGTVKITKVDARDATLKLPGAVYGIYRFTAETAPEEGSDLPEPDFTLTTGEDGTVTSPWMPFLANTFFLVKEITPPEGYLLSDEFQIVTFTEPGETAEVTFHNVSELGALIIRKVDALNPGKTLAGAEFKLFSDEACKHQVGSAVTTGTDGIARFDDLEPGDYWLKETKAPKDYDLLTDPVPVAVEAGVTEPDPYEIQDQYNPPDPYNTGSMDWNILLLGAVALLGGVALVAAPRKRRATHIR